MQLENCRGRQVGQRLRGIRDTPLRRIYDSDPAARNEAQQSAPGNAAVTVPPAPDAL